ncbi:hypothetical protein K1T71_008734 [Dendrolimus kikuchii]|uniref:Uncharacterized protein n=1 Tax=Dendrolimus kikuchii TaxID=765133 RepID=A0ACC1CVC3_9NEOP|nr:hypothetical protein K1T71_008734 [Dendrolimus kikuchii]
MKFVQNTFVLITLMKTVHSLLCYNGTFDYRGFGVDPVVNRGLFTPSSKMMTRIRCSLTILCAENAMCFVRSWSARAHHAWVVQRGCYQALVNDPLPNSLSLPTRSMTCKRERLPDAEYKVCLCKADWCNEACYITPYRTKFKNILSFLLIYFAI